MVIDCWAMEGDGGRSMRKWREMFKPGWVARHRFVIIASDAATPVSREPKPDMTLRLTFTRLPPLGIEAGIWGGILRLVVEGLCIAAGIEVAGLSWG